MKIGADFLTADRPAPCAPVPAGGAPSYARRPAVLLLTVAVVFMLGVSTAWAGQGYEKVTSTFGSAGSGPGLFNKPTAIAVNDETEEVYVLDSGNDRVEGFNKEHKFQSEFNGSGDNLAVEGKAAPTGKFLKPTGIAVDSDPSSESYGDVYVADTGPGHEVVDKFSATGKYEGQLAGGKCDNPANPDEIPPCSESKVVPFSDLLNVAVDTSGNVWVDEGDGPISEGLQFVEVDGFSDTGSSIATFPLLVSAVDGEFRDSAFAVDSGDDVFMLTAAAVYEFDKAKGYGRISLAGAAGRNSPLATLAIISSTGNLLVDQGSSIELFKSPFLEGAPLFTFPATGLSESAGIAVNGAKGEGTIYATQRGADDVDVFEPEPAKAPVVVSESASSLEKFEVQFAAGIDSENRETTYSFQYSYSKQTVEEGNGEVAGGGAIPAEFGDAEVTSPVVEEGIKNNQTIYYRVVAENEESKGTPTYGEVEAYTKLPLVANETYSSLTSTGVKLDATVNPVFDATNYGIEFAASEKLLEEGKGTFEEILDEGLGSKDRGTVVGTGETQGGGAPEPVSTEIAGLQPGRTYYYRVVAVSIVTRETSNANKGAPVRGPIEEVRPYAAPAVVTGAAQNITGTAATLSGEVNPERTEAKYYFAYISKAGYQKALENHAANPASPHYQEELAKGAVSPYAEGDTTATFSLPVSASPQAVGPIPATDLLPGETYHYALVAVNKFELQTIGSDQTFATQAGTPPLVSTGGASAVSQNAATLSGTVTTNGLQTNYGFEIGTSPNNYGPATGLGAIGGSLTEEVHVTLGELAPGTTYYYRVTATNADGTEKGQPGTFTTPGFPTLIAPPASPPLIAYTSPGFPAEEKASGSSATGATSKGELAKALRGCRKDRSKRKRTKCEKQAKAKHGKARPE